MTARWSHAVGKPHAVALPVGARPLRLERRRRRRRSPASSARVPVGRLATPGDDPSGRRSQLLTADRRLDVGHPVVEAEHRVLLEDHLGRRVPDAVVHAHPVLAQQAELASSAASVVVSMPPSPVVITLRGWNEKQAMSPCGRPIRSHSPSQQDLAADRAGRVLDHRQAVPVGDSSESRRGRTGMPDLVDGQDRLGPRRDGRLDQRRVDVVRRRVDVDEHRRRAAVADRRWRWR